ncbi:hypothetical protein [Streptomyces sp. NPDC093225]|uniref:hypothetical protein n=1 Tax=Streptomyces sp. NPDC093225 TaxID=3366034 RepID=UPI0037FEE0E3
MTEHAASGGPLIPMPALTPAALRAAVAQIAPAHLPAFVEHLDRAAEQSTIAPLRAFLQWWGEFVAVQRHPARASRLHELEAAAAQAADRDTLDAAVAEIQEILAAARREAAA